MTQREILEIRSAHASRDGDDSNSSTTCSMGPVRPDWTALEEPGSSAPETCTVTSGDTCSTGAPSNRPQTHSIIRI